MLKNIFFSILLLFFIGCKKEISNEQLNSSVKNINKTDFATGFDILKERGHNLIVINEPWKNSKKSLRYLLLEKDDNIPNSITYDEIVRVPIKKLVVTSTTHIPILEALGELKTLVGFPNTDYISSVSARELVKNGKIKELGANSNINLETIIDLSPDVVIGFGVDGTDKALDNIKKFGIPVLYNSEWLENHALGRAEWIKFFGLLFDKEKEANQIFDGIKQEYFKIKKLAQKTKNRPTVLSGMPYKDTWYLPNGNSWAAQFFLDANACYLWQNEKGNGSVVLNFETVLEKAKNADYWIAVSDYQTKKQLLDSNLHYKQFKMYKEDKIYFSNIKGHTGGMLFYELAPSRPDLVLKDLVKIFHPELLPNYKLNFYSQLI